MPRLSPSVRRRSILRAGVVVVTAVACAQPIPAAEWPRVVGWTTADSAGVGARITQVEVGSVADRLGLRAGDLVVGVGRTPTRNGSAVNAALAATRQSSISVQVRRDTLTTEVVVPVRAKAMATIATVPEAQRRCATLRASSPSGAFAESGCAVALRTFCNGCRG